MKILVPIKRVVDYNVKVRVNEAGTMVDLNNVKMSINPFCEIAVEEAIRLKESGWASEVVVVSIGDIKAEEQLRAAMALGADRGILVEASSQLSSLKVAKTLQKIVAQEQPNLILLGKQAIDSDNNQTAQMLAALLDCPQATFASKVTIDGERVVVEREIDGGAETLSLSLPAIVSTDLRLNEPRYAKLPDIMKAKKKPLEKTALADYGISADSTITTVAVQPPKQRSAGIKVASVDELIDKLKSEAKVIV